MPPKRKGKTPAPPAAPAAPAADGPAWARPVRDGVLVEIAVKPNAKAAAFQGVEDGRLRVAIDSPPVDGKANAAVVAFLAGVLGVKRSSVSVVKGMTAHHKTVLLEGATVEAVTARVAGEA